MKAGVVLHERSPADTASSLLKPIKMGTCWKFPSAKAVSLALVKTAPSISGSITGA